MIARVLSLGGGVQSSAMLLMAARGEFGEPPDLAIFADTHHEPRLVMEHLAWLEAEVASKIEVVRVSAGDLLEKATGGGFNPIPLYLRRPDGTAGLGRRQCTREFKISPIHREMRRRRITSAELWLGISIDEATRMKPSRVKWVTNRYPLIERRLSRQDCIRWLREYGVPHEVPKSACVFCPYKSPRDFARMRDTDPEAFAAAVAADEAMRDAPDGMGEQFVLRTLTPLRDVRTIEDMGQLTLDDMDECEGGCFL